MEKSNKTKVEVLRGSITSTGCIRRSWCHEMVLFSPRYGEWVYNESFNPSSKTRPAKD